MRRLLLITMLAVLVLPAAAAARSYDVRGGGFGHGVGMSQYGAYGFAQKGFGYRQILAHYYRGTAIGSVQGERVRVLLLASAPEPASFSNATRVGRTAVDPGKTYTARANRRGRMVVRTAGGQRVGRFGAPLTVRGQRNKLRLGGTAINGVRNGRYRGRLELRPGAVGGITVVNNVGIDDYVRGVIAAEMPASWHEEALKVQAVAARSYAIATNAGGAVFDQYPDTRSQVYDGIAAETRSTNRAARATAGQVVLHRGAVATTYFSSTSGGHTEDVENIFGGPALPYLRGVPDPYDDISPLHSWRYRFSRRELEADLGSLVKGRFRRLKVLERGASPRIIRAKVIGSAGRTTVSGNTLKFRLDTPDIPRGIKRVRRAGATGAATSASASKG